MIYTDGTIAIKAGSPIVTGTGTQWKKNIHGVAPGQLISIENGTAPVSMMIRAVNSDTELVLSFNAPVTLSGAKYSIATTVPDTISDAARTMSANQGYIVYFLQAMQQWMTDTGQVEIELPNGQKVTLDSVKAMSEAIANAKPGDATTTQKGVVQLSETIGTSTTKVPHEKAVSDALSKKADTSTLGTAAGKNYGTSIGDVMLVGTYGWGGTGHISHPERDALVAQMINLQTPSHIQRIDSDNPDITFKYSALAYFKTLDTFTGITGDQSTGNVRVFSGSTKTFFIANMWSDKNTVVDGNGFIKAASPVIQIHQGGNFETNDESEGAEIRRTGTGQYHITGILGYNSDGAWGVNGGISVPKDNNGLELVYVADRVLEDGSIIIETCHRQHAHLPERFQNWRLKAVTPEGERIFYQDGEPCDLPESTRLDVRVEMPQGSVWNVKQRELAEQMEREQAGREAQEAAGQAGDSEE
ncbi:phage tail fiber protein [Morganella morganii]|uniref:phage tail fiber protein n=1 Tax=Morganella morganii TaxID=582 RepID=UPI0025B5EDF2|nr:hypothetical protein [Morganella morganii]MDN3813634.1 hypothetical protein [Morganella morganii]